ncbi:aldose epimerase family protein [Magnetospira sp. QH-2]|uniref:aldose epimerase family protein n=1 Tax=Magnetospira sp. (strain QH-2) TaxID=1288970 RepID=UPI0003E80B9F|nr:aldose epimerase family protein [Magnetospira sp. QH-2]CCQ75113.1 Aldose 1-epimerase [Magnetospira sp. QH-2]
MVRREPFGQANLFHLNAGGSWRITLTNFGAALVAWHMPDGDGQAGNILLGFDDFQDYLDDDQFTGVIVGRFANRIAQGRFNFAGTPYLLPRNDSPNHLHGGPDGFHRRVWEADVFERSDHVGVRFGLLSPHGDQGYPGTLTVRAHYRLYTEDRLTLDLEADSDRPTLVNLACHAYFNLAGGGSVLDHRIQVHASRYLPINEACLPTGEIRSVEGSALDLRRPQSLRGVLSREDQQLTMAGGVDHCLVVDGHPGELRPAANVEDPASGRRLRVAATQPGVQVYSGNNLKGMPFKKHAGLCLETQHFPDSPNQPGFPSTVIDPDHPYRERMVFT